MCVGPRRARLGRDDQQALPLLPPESAWDEVAAAAATPPRRTPQMKVRFFQVAATDTAYQRLYLP